MVVFVATIPASLCPVANDRISSICENDRSGAIFTNTGLGEGSESFFSWTARNNASSSSRPCKVRRPGVFGELTLRTK